MKYKKLNLLFFFRLFSLIIFIIAIGFFSEQIKDSYKAEVDKVAEFQHESSLSEIQKIKIDMDKIDKISNFSSQIDYLMYALIIGIALITFIDAKVRSENKRLDKLDGVDNN